MTEPIAQITLYRQWLHKQRGLSFDSYDALWQWSVDHLEDYWASVWDYFGLHSPTPRSAVLHSRQMPLAQWFPGAQVNFARQVLRHVGPAHAAGLPAVISDNELGEVRELSWPALAREVAAVALSLRALGVQRGDRVAAYLPNVPETMVCALACASIGAVWSVCAPDMGTPAVLDRFRQITPRVLIAADGVHYAGRAVDRSAVVRQLRAELPSVQHLLVLHTPWAEQALPGAIDLAQVRSGAHLGDEAALGAFEPEWLPFDHPLWIVYSSGTTGLPKPIVHGHGGILLTLLAMGILHNDIGCSYADNTRGERYHWYSSTGWVMWNAQMAGLLGGTTCCIYDGSPAGTKEAPDWTVLWRFAARHRVSWFGAGAAWWTNTMKAGVDLQALRAAGHDVSAIRAIGTTGSPLPADVQQWQTAQFRALRQTAPGLASAAQEHGGHDIWLCNISGGTDFCGAFIGGNRELPQVPGQMQCRLLGCHVEAWDENGHSVTGEVGELVCRSPIPSMPLYFWGDEGHARYLSSYFDMYPGVWRHGDWLRIGADGGCVIYGRSDATINRHGLRMGTSEIYAAVEAIPEILDSMVVDLEYLGRRSFMPLFITLRPGASLDDALRERIRSAIRTALSPRFIPDDIVPMPEIPRTLSGKKQELPIKKLLLGQPIDRVVNRDAMANPGCLPHYEAYAQAWLASQPQGG